MKLVIKILILKTNRNWYNKKFSGIPADSYTIFLNGHKNDIRESHIGVSEKNTSELVLTEDCFKKDYHHKPLHLSLDGKHFFLNIFRQHGDGMWFFYVAIIGTVLESNNYIYGLTISNGTRVSFSSILTHAI